MMRRMNPWLRFLAGLNLAVFAFVLAPQAAASAGTEHGGARTAAAVHFMHGRPGPATAGTRVSTNDCNNTCTVAVSPRLSLSGCSRQDGFNGDVQWNTEWIAAWGEVWDVCGTTATAWLKWYSPNVHNSEVGQAPPYTTQGFNFPEYGGMTSPGNISVTVCATWHGSWTCGPSEPVNPPSNFSSVSRTRPTG